MTGAEDHIVLAGLRATGRHGWFDWEREQGQDFVVDVELTMDTRPAAATDDLSATVDYGALGASVTAVVQGEPVRLIETLAARIAQVCLADPRVQQATVTVHKPQAPMPVAFTDVAVTVVRRRG